MAAWSTGRAVALTADEGLLADSHGATVDLARVVACQYLGRDMQGGPHQFGFDLLADLLVSRLGAETKRRELDAVADPKGAEAQ